MQFYQLKHNTTTIILSAIALTSLAGKQCPTSAAEPTPVNVEKVAQEIRTEASRPDDSTGYPLPLFGSWNTGTLPTVLGVTPAYQIQLIEKGHHVLMGLNFPNISIDAPPREAYDKAPAWSAYYEDALKRAATLKLPITLVSSQWERLLTDDKAYFDLPADQNPNVVTAEGTVLKKLSAFSRVELWREVGTKWGSSPLMKQLQEWYPDPPVVELLSNNEHPKSTWSDIEDDPRYLKLYGKGRDDNFKRKVVADAWIERYRALQDGIRQALVSPNWRANARFVGYEAFGPYHMGRWPGWPTYSLYIPGRIDPNPLYWDGGSPSYYLRPWAEGTDYTVMSPQVEASNAVFLLHEAKRLNPRYWFELSVWDGYLMPHRVTEKRQDKRTTFRKLGQQYEPPRYGGMVQFGLWLLRPRVVRDYRDHDDTVETMEPYFMPQIEAVDRVYNNPTLREFWRHGELVPTGPNRIRTRSAFRTNTKPPTAGSCSIRI